MADYTKKGDGSEERVAVQAGACRFYRADEASSPAGHLRLVIATQGARRAGEPIDRPVSGLLSASEAELLEQLLDKAQSQALAEAGYSLLPPPARQPAAPVASEESGPSTPLTPAALAAREAARARK